MSDDVQTPAEDKGWLCWVAARLSQMWDFIDKREIDKHTVSVAVMWASYQLTTWAVMFANTSTRPGAEVAMIIGAVLGPWTIVQTASISFYFRARTA